MAGSIPRPELKAAVTRALRRSRVVLLIGPRQCGKTTLAREIGDGAWFDLEDPETPLQPEVARQVLEPLTGLVVIDEFQRQPRLFELLRVLVDRARNRARFLILGSAAPELVKGASETLAGRIETVEMAGFDLDEVAPRRRDALWLRGGFPRSLLARNDGDSAAWRSSFMQTFLERDVPQLGVRVPATTLRRFWTMLAHYHGQVWNAAELARSIGSGENAARHYLDLLTGTFMVRQLPPWFENVGKRVVKSPKIYLRDCGLLHSLLGIERRLDLFAHPKLGASWEGFALEHIVRVARAERDAYFWATHAGAELDLLIARRGRRIGFELKHQDTPRMTKSMHTSLADLKLDHLYVVRPAKPIFSLHPRVTVVGLDAVRSLNIDR